MCVCVCVNINLQIQESQQFQEEKLVKLLKIKGKEKMLKATLDKRHIKYMGKTI